MSSILQQHDGQVTGNALTPERRRVAAVAPDRIRRRPQRRVGIQHVPRETLEQAGLRGGDAEVSQLHLRLRPCQRAGSREGVGIVMLVEQVEYLRARFGDTGPE